MEQKSTSIWKSSLLSGVYVGIALILISVIFYVTGNPFAKPAQWASYAAMIIGIVLAQISLKKEMGGTMTYGQALGVGVLTMLFASIVSSIYTYLLYEIIDPSLQEQLRLFTEEQIIKQGKVPEDQMEMALNMATKFQTPIMMVVMGIFGVTFIGTIISLITAIFTKKNPTDEIPE